MGILGGVSRVELLSDAELLRILRSAADVAAGDVDHDLVSTLYVLNTDVLRPSGLRQIYEAELHQIARALYDLIPGDQRAGVAGGAVAEVNAWLARRRGSGHRRGEAQRALTGLFMAAAAKIEAKASAYGSSGRGSPPDGRAVADTGEAG